MSNLREDQVHRILEDIQSVALGAQVTEGLLSLMPENNLKKALKMNVELQKNLLDALGRDIQGMLNGNSKGG